jgi:hypothetical protein
MKSKTIEAASGECVRLDRRRFLKVTSAGTALGLSGESLFGSFVYAESKGAIKIAGAMYNLETAIVDFFA